MAKENPILFTAEMIRAILDGRKTVTRRIIMPQPEVFDNTGFPDYACLKDFKKKWNPSDLLYVRETWSAGIEWDDTKPSKIDLLGTGSVGDVWYWADGEPDMGWGKKRPSILMPKLFTRLWLEIVSIRAERLQEITEGDAIREGIEYWGETSRGDKIYRVYLKNTSHLDKPCDGPGFYYRTGGPKICFQMLWDSINARRGYSWESNPWVLRIEFKDKDNG